MKTPEILSALQKRFGSADFSKWYVQRQPYYDYVRLKASGTTQVNFFVNPVGATDPVSALNKTLEETNMTKANSFGNQFFLLTQIRCDAAILPKCRQPAGINDQANSVFELMTGMMEKYLNLLNLGVLQISIGQKDYFDIERPFMTAPRGFGLDVRSWGAKQGAADGHSVWVFQSPFDKDCFNLNPNPVFIEPEQPMSVQLNFDSNTPDFTNAVGGNTTPAINVGVWFDGYVVRPAQ